MSHLRVFSIDLIIVLLRFSILMLSLRIFPIYFWYAFTLIPRLSLFLFFPYIARCWQAYMVLFNSTIILICTIIAVYQEHILYWLHYFCKINTLSLSAIILLRCTCIPITFNLIFFIIIINLVVYKYISLLLLPYPIVIDDIIFVKIVFFFVNNKLLK